MFWGRCNQVHHILFWMPASLVCCLLERKKKLWLCSFRYVDMEEYLVFFTGFWCSGTGWDDSCLANYNITILNFWYTKLHANYELFIDLFVLQLIISLFRFLPCHFARRFFIFCRENTICHDCPVWCNHVYTCWWVNLENDLQASNYIWIYTLNFLF